MNHDTNRMNVTAVFDIGKTNKKFFLFNENLQEVYKEYSQFQEIVDEDGHPTEDLTALKSWLKSLFHRILTAKKFKIKAINFSTYGASFVHLDKHKNPLTPLYNYTKNIDSKVIDLFIKRHGPQKDLLSTTGCANISMLNSGLQLFWLKYFKPEVFKKIDISLHLPQYLSFIFTGIPLSEYTSLGCHTLLWDYTKNDYHSWVYKEEFDKILAPIVSSETSINMNYNGTPMKIGVGIHDSSSALLPYIRSVEKKFVLVSTGTWSIVLNPFTNHQNHFEDGPDVIYYMRIDGKPVKARRLFLGNEYKIQVAELDGYYGVGESYHRGIQFNCSIYNELIKNFKNHFRWKSITDKSMADETVLDFENYEIAYHQLMMELVNLQMETIKQVLDESNPKHIYIDGGFSHNSVYINLLSHHFRDKKLRTTDASLGSALGAAIVISDVKLNSKFLKKNYALKKHASFIIS